MKKRRRRGRRNNTGAISVAVIVVALLVVLSVQVYKLKQKDAMYAQRETEAQAALEKENQRTEDIDALSAYMKSQDYIEDVAQSKLGLAYENQIIFKERSE